MSTETQTDLDPKDAAPMTAKRAEALARQFCARWGLPDSGVFLLGELLIDVFYAGATKAHGDHARQLREAAERRAGLG